MNRKDSKNKELNYTKILILIKKFNLKILKLYIISFLHNIKLFIIYC